MTESRIIPSKRRSLLAMGAHRFNRDNESLIRDLTLRGLSKLDEWQLPSSLMKTNDQLRTRNLRRDVVQETFAKAYQSLERFEWQGEDSLMSWLRKISENVVLRAADRQKSERLFELQRRLGQRDSDVTASRVVQRGERFERLETALASLSPDHRQVIVLARIEGLQMKEIAQRMNRSVGAAQNLLFRALKELKKAFGDTESFHLPDRRLGIGGHEDAK